MFRTREWIAPAVATVAFLVALAAFVVVLSRYRDSVMEWSGAELQSRAELTAVALAEPLRTLDFKAINSTADRLKAEGLRLRIVSGREFYVSGTDRARASTTRAESRDRRQLRACGALRTQETSTLAWGVRRPRC